MTPEQPIPPQRPVPPPPPPPPPPGYRPPPGPYPQAPWPPPPPPRPRRSYALPLVAVLGVLVLLAAGVVIAVAVSGGSTHGQATTAGGTGTVPPPSAAGSASGALDPCLVGIWTETSHQEQQTVGTDAVQFLGHGAVQRFQADGTASIAYGGGVTYIAELGADLWEIVHLGNITFHWQTGNGTVRYTGVQAIGTETLKKNGVDQQKSVLSAPLDGQSYSCAGSLLREWGDGYKIELSRAGG